MTALYLCNGHWIKRQIVWRASATDFAAFPRVAHTRDNGSMPMVPTGLVHQGHLAAEITKAEQKLGREAFHVSYNVGADSTGEPSIFFRIVLTDAASTEDKVVDVARRISAILFDEIRPIENWGLHPYFTFRSYSEQQKSHDPEWE